MSAKRQVWLNLPVDLPDPILPNPLDGDGLLYAAGDLKRDTLAPVGRGKSLRMAARPLSDWGRIGREKGEKLLFHRDLLSKDGKRP